MTEQGIRMYLAEDGRSTGKKRERQEDGWEKETVCTWNSSKQRTWACDRICLETSKSGSSYRLSALTRWSFWNRKRKDRERRVHTPPQITHHPPTCLEKEESWESTRIKTRRKRKREKTRQNKNFSTYLSLSISLYLTLFTSREIETECMYREREMCVWPLELLAWIDGSEVSACSLYAGNRRRRP